jgi:hypothetical protein
MRPLLLFFLICISFLEAAVRLPKFDLGGSDKQRIKLDLAGRLMTVFVGPPKPSESSKGPLVEIEDLPVSAAIAADFDLSQQIKPVRWLGIFCWAPKREAKMIAIVERDTDGNRAVQVQAPLRKKFSCHARYADNQPAQITLKVAPHSRFRTEWCFVDTPSFPTASSETNPNWWIPDVSVSATGRLNSNWQTCAYDRDSRNVQLRFTVRRNLGWTFLGRNVHESPETWCSFQVDGSYHPMYATSAILSGQIEDLSSWGLCLRQFVASSRIWPASLRWNLQI